MKKQLLYQNKKIVYRVHGIGQPVILVHGFGEDASVWNRQVEFLKNNFTVIVPDLPGSGESELTDDVSMDGMAEVIHSIIHEEEIDSCPVIGHSMGGYITLALVEKYYNHVSSFGLFHSSAFADSEEKIATRRKGIAFIKEHGAFEFLKTATPNLFSAITKDERPELIDEQVASLSSFSAASLVSYYEAMIQRPDRTDILRKATVSVLFAMGKYDNAIPLADVLKQCHLPEKSYIHILQHSGHMGMLEETKETNLLLEKFLLQ